MEDLGVPLSIEDAKALDVLNRPNSKSTYARQKPLKYNSSTFLRMTACPKPFLILVGTRLNSFVYSS